LSVPLIVDAISLFVKDSRSLLKVAILQAMLTTRRMRIVSIYQIAQTKLSTECDQGIHNLLLVITSVHSHIPCRVSISYLFNTRQKVMPTPDE
jgi:hypothetical protein